MTGRFVFFWVDGLLMAFVGFERGSGSWGWDGLV